LDFSGSQHLFWFIDELVPSALPKTPIFDTRND
jgi:hypothetical protein